MTKTAKCNKQLSNDQNNKRKRKKIFDFNKNENHNEISQSMNYKSNQQ